MAEARTDEEKAQAFAAMTGSISVIDNMLNDDDEFCNDMTKEEKNCLLYTSPSPRDGLLSRMPSSAFLIAASILVKSSDPQSPNAF